MISFLCHRFNEEKIASKCFSDMACIKKNPLACGFFSEVVFLLIYVELYSLCVTMIKKNAVLNYLIILYKP